MKQKLLNECERYGVSEGSMKVEVIKTYSQKVRVPWMVEGERDTDGGSDDYMDNVSET